VANISAVIAHDLADVVNPIGGGIAERTVHVKRPVGAINI
jgi:hypothetical protein